jgi:hypothetical protein
VDLVVRLPGEAANKFLGATLSRGPVFAVVAERVMPISGFPDEEQTAARVAIELARFHGSNWKKRERSRPSEEIALRYLEAYDKHTKLDDPRALLRLTIDYARDLVEGLDWLRERGFNVIDLKTDNLGMRGDDEVVIFDFGYKSRTSATIGAEDVELASNSRSPLPRTRRSFDRHFDEAENRFHDLGTVELHQDEKAGSDNGVGADRQFGYCMSGPPIRIAFASKAEELPDKNLDGLMAHEWGHVLDYRYGKRELEKMLKKRLPEGAERRADAIAEIVFGKTIKYDRNDVQCVSCRGESPRPRRLGP